MMTLSLAKAAAWRAQRIMESSVQDAYLLPNKITALDAAMEFLFHAVRHLRGASEFNRSTTL